MSRVPALGLKRPVFDARGTRRAAHWLRWLRLPRVYAHVLACGIGALAFFPMLTKHQRRRLVQGWSRRALDILCVRVQVHGAVPAPHAPVMLVSNHVSWLDIVVLSALMPARVVAKSEVRDWPVIGKMAAGTGTLFIRRAHRKDTARLAAEAHEALCAGEQVLVFAEGTTSDGTEVLKFHSSLFQPALSAQVPVQPIGIRFERQHGELCTEVAYTAGRSVLDTLLAIVRLPHVVAHVHFAVPLAGHDGHRRELARDAREAIVRALFPAARSSRTESAPDPQVVAPTAADPIRTLNPALSRRAA